MTSNDVGVCAEFELNYENAKIIKKLVDNRWNAERKQPRLYDANEFKDEYCMDGLYGYHAYIFNMNCQKSVPNWIRSFMKENTQFDYTVLNAVLNGEEDDKLKEYFDTRGEIEKSFILNFSVQTPNYDKKPLNLQLKIAKSSIEMFKSLGVKEDNIVSYKHELL